MLPSPRRTLLAVLAGLLPLAAGAAELEPLALRPAALLDVRAGRLIASPLIIVRGDRIEAVGDGPPPAGARVLDLPGLTLLPGLIDLHTHLSVGRTGNEEAPDPWSFGDADQAVQAACNARATLAAGFTTVREAGSVLFLDVALARAVARGAAAGPRIVPSGHQISMTGGHGDNVGYPPGQFELTPEQGVADGPDALLRAVRYQIKHGAEVVKVMATAGVLSLEATADARQLSDEELRAVVDEAHRQRVKVAAHAHGREGILAAVLAGVDTIEHGSMLDDEILAEMARRGTWLVPTAYVNTAGGARRPDQPEAMRAKGEWITERARESLRRAIAAGIPIGFGTDAGTFPHGRNGREFGALVDAGLTPLAAIRAATVDAAAALGKSDRGAIEAGLFADLVGVAGDPLADVRVLEAVAFVMQGGRVVRHSADDERLARCDGGGALPGL